MRRTSGHLPVSRTVPGSAAVFGGMAAIAQRIIHRCGERIRAPTKFARGATFFFTLKQVPPAAATSSPTAGR